MYLKHHQLPIARSLLIGDLRWLAQIGPNGPQLPRTGGRPLLSEVAFVTMAYYQDSGNRLDERVLDLLVHGPKAHNLSSAQPGTRGNILTNWKAPDKWMAAE